MKELKKTRRSVARERAVLVEVITHADDDPDGHRDQLEELWRLADTAGVEVVATMTQRRTSIHPSTYVGSGKVEELKALAESKGAHVVIFGNNLTPAQVRNLEKAIDIKTIDRSELILDIFASRARTLEAKLQVELAQLEYTLPRLKQMWGHLSRMEGGGGIATRGPGETQLESDRRLARNRIQELKEKLRTVDARKEREVLARGNQLTVGLVGYTNAGKSSLLNALTGSDAYVEDKLFATLDTRTRGWRLPHGLTALLSDTVGFIRDLPHHLVASFKATLEEAVHANLLLHVVDVSTEHVQADLEAVEKVLAEIGCKDTPQLVVLNKADLVEDPIRLDIVSRARPGSVAVSAKTGQGLEELTREVTERLAGAMQETVIRSAAGNGRLLAWIQQHAIVLSQEVEDGQIVTRVRMPARLIDEIPRVARQASTATDAL
ncbi:MAG: GTPase HflX [Planctomycetota bacterium]|nr:GTPase HflX [Planctomycetota bacterium]